MISFGPLWEAKLKSLWEDSSLSLSEIARCLRVDPLTIRRHAERLKLPFHHCGRNSNPLTPTAKLKGNVKLLQNRNKLLAYRDKWLSALQITPKLTLKAMRRKLPRVYVWLFENDSEWLKKYLPPATKQHRCTHSVDWKRRDSQYAAAAKTAAARLKNAPGRPVRVTKTVIGRDLGAVTLLQQKLCKMPLTAHILANEIETREEYAVRRIWWAADLFFQETALPREWQLVMRANVYNLRANPEIQRSIEAALKMIEAKLSLLQRLQAVS